MNVADRVKALIKKHDTCCPFRIARELGILVETKQLGETMGLYIKRFRVKAIIINENANEKQRIFICAHELGHAILHPDTNMSNFNKHTFYSTNPIEREANMFAKELLFGNLENDCISVFEAEKEYKLPDSVIKDFYK